MTKDVKSLLKPPEMYIEKEDSKSHEKMGKRPNIER